MKARLKLIRRWLNFAKEDLRAAEVSINENLHNIVCFHSQQAAEKSIKALYLYYFDTIPKTHDLEAILNKLKEKSAKLSKFEEEFRFLNKFYVPTRYPDALPGSLPEGLPDKNDAQKASNFAKEILQFIKNLFNKLHHET